MKNRILKRLILLNFSTELAHSLTPIEKGLLPILVSTPIF